MVLRAIIFVVVIFCLSTIVCCKFSTGEMTTQMVAKPL